MPNLIINGEKIKLEINDLQQLINQRFTRESKFAVAVNQVFISKKNYSEIKLNDGDQIELVMPMQGG